VDVDIPKGKKCQRNKEYGQEQKRNALRKAQGCDVRRKPLSPRGQAGEEEGEDWRRNIPEAPDR